MAKKSFIKGAAILGIAGILVKVLGAFFRIPLANLIGDVGMAYYQAVYPVYNIFLAVSTAGIPVAISKMVSERNAIGRYNEGYRVFKISFFLMFAIGIVSASLCFFGAEPYFTACKIPEAKYAMMALAPALLLVPMMASFRGYFQGNQNMTPTAISQVMEQVFRVVVGLALAYVFLSKGLEFSAAGAAFGATAGSIGGILVVIIIYFSGRGKYRVNIERSAGKIYESASSILLKIFAFAVPITLGAAIMPIMNAIDVPIVMNRLQNAAGFSPAEAKALYGQLSGFPAGTYAGGIDESRAGGCRNAQARQNKRPSRQHIYRLQNGYINGTSMRCRHDGDSRTYYAAFLSYAESKRCRCSRVPQDNGFWCHIPFEHSDSYRRASRRWQTVYTGNKYVFRRSR